jgi:filamentous hemagglutinin
LHDSFPVIDKFKDGIATSIKSLDLQAASYQKPGVLFKKVQGYIDDVAEFEQGAWGDFAVRAHEVRGRALDLGIPPGATPEQRLILAELRAYGETRGVRINIEELE